ncbi:MAG: 23S rRNA (adenine(2503)-C(2))-methyltransferase RlmN [Chloroflexi bacterium]|nr:23S rRNA (adenine(2503)-C(2))-methyltransferase RlmN [Chloroflexota bacterium]|tara:strand:- start:8240 stop:9364 length:1125 start_codon:yes stop_codon:yes gene_type:complete
MEINKKLILGLEKKQISKEIFEIGHSSYRSDQIWHSIYRDFISDFDEITTIPQSLIIKLKDDYIFNSIDLVLKKISEDKSTDKYLWKLRDNEYIETVLMRYDPDGHRRRRRTVCVSTQAGCALGCTFCATGQQGFSRQLTVAEIVEQVLNVKKDVVKEKKNLVNKYSLKNDEINDLTNVVFMGMGEPLANYENTMSSIRILNDPKGLNIGARHITISTVGLVPQIIKLAEEDIQVNLAVSLHAPDNITRSETMPVNKRYPVEELIGACKEYFRKTNRKIFFEYVLLSGQNDTLEHANKLSELLKGLLCHVNLIPVNPTAGSSLERSKHNDIKNFREILLKNAISSTMRMEKGIDINAGCGQLRSSYISMEKKNV